MALLGCGLNGAAPDAERPALVTLTGRAMGTGWVVKWMQPAAALDTERVRQDVAARLEELEMIFSTYRPQSALSHFNADERTEWVPVTEEMAHVAHASREISALTGGAFDVTVEPLVRLWGFGATRRAGAIPAAAEIVAVREQVDWRKLEVRLSPPALRKTSSRVRADFSSMAKGFAADAISELLVRRGVPNHLVQVGGDIKTAGTAAGGDGWRMGIEQPVDGSPAVACIVTLSGQALSTSGDHRNFFQFGGQRYGHIIDPRTGRPAVSTLASVSVVHASCAWSSALATALFVLGPDEGLRLAAEQGFACLFLVRSDAGIVAHATPAFERLRE